MPDIDDIATRIFADVQTVPIAGPVIVHGDICAENILVDTEGRLLALLDWGFLSSSGHPIFDIAVAASIYDIDSAHANEHREELIVSMGGLCHCDRDDLGSGLACTRS
ncbi:MAG: aminoglycoside phosphotransferase family protein [Rhodoglobus sp.]